MPELLAFVCQSEGFYEHAVGTSAGSLSPRTNWDSLASYEFALPPIGEQQRIVKVLAGVAALGDKLHAALSAGQRQVEAIRWAAITGRTTRGRTREITEWTNGRPPGVTELPESWSLVRLTEVAKLESGHTPSKRRPDYWSGDIPWVSLHDTGSLDRPWIANTAQTISKLGIRNSSARVLPAGTVVVSRTASIGLCSVMSREMATSQDFANFICDERQLLSHYLYYVFRAMKVHLTHVAAGSTHKTVYLPFFESMQIPLPPLSQQRAIVELLASVDASQDALQSRLDDCKRLGGFFGAALMDGRVQ